MNTFLNIMKREAKTYLMMTMMSRWWCLQQLTVLIITCLLSSTALFRSARTWTILVFMEYFNNIPSICFYGIFWQYSLNLILWNILTIFPPFVFMEYFDNIPSICFYGIFWQYSLNFLLWNILTILPQFALRA